MISLLAESNSLHLRSYWPLMIALWNASWMRLLAFESPTFPNDRSSNWLAIAPSFLALNVSPSPFPLANQSIAIPAQSSFENDPLRARWPALACSGLQPIGNWRTAPAPKPIEACPYLRLISSRWLSWISQVLVT